MNEKIIETLKSKIWANIWELENYRNEYVKKNKTELVQRLEIETKTLIDLLEKSDILDIMTN